MLFESLSLEAGRRAIERFANAEAIAHLTNGLEALEHFPEGAERDRKELTLQANLGTVLGSSKGYTPPEGKSRSQHSKLLTLVSCRFILCAKNGNKRGGLWTKLFAYSEQQWMSTFDRRTRISGLPSTTRLSKPTAPALMLFH